MTAVYELANHVRQTQLAVCRRSAPTTGHRLNPGRRCALTGYPLVDADKRAQVFRAADVPAAELEVGRGRGLHVNKSGDVVVAANGVLRGPRPEGE